MRLIIWPDKPKMWSAERAYRAGDLVVGRDDHGREGEFVCVNTYRRAGIFSPFKSSLWHQIHR